MNRATSELSRFLRAGAAWAALACSLATTAPVRAQGADEPTEPPAAPSPQVGAILIAPDQAEVSRRLVPLLGSALAWASDGDTTGWAQLGADLHDREPGATATGWALVLDANGLRPEPSDPAEPTPGLSVAFDMLLRCNAFRTASPQPFSRSARGRALDALTIDNARNARLTGLYTDPDDPETLTIVLFAESRAQTPGRWDARRLATATVASTRGDPAPPHPVQLDFGERWKGVVLATADLALALDPDSSDTISSAERFEAWGLSRAAAARRLAAGFDGRVWLWPGQEEGSLLCALPLARGSTDRRVAEGLRSVFGSRLTWTRGESGRVTATLKVREGEHRLALAMRFITIADRASLTISTHAAELDSAAETLADITR